MTSTNFLSDATPPHSFARPNPLSSMAHDLHDEQRGDQGRAVLVASFIRVAILLAAKEFTIQTKLRLVETGFVPVGRSLQRFGVLN